MELALTPHSVIIVFLIITVGATLQGSAGLGLGFIAVPLLAIVDQRYLPGPLLLAALVLTIFMSYRDYKSIQFKGIQWVVSGRLIGSTLGAYLLTIVPADYLSILFATMIIMAVILSITGLRLPLNAKNLLGTGTLSGLMSTTSAIGGAPMALIYQYLSGPGLRGTLSSIFVIGTIISLIMLLMIGRFGVTELLLSLILLPGIFAGLFLSKYTTKILDRGFIRPAVLLFSLLSGGALILKSLI
jgi:uncharacterized membrane protein YfcA